MATGFGDAEQIIADATCVMTRTQSTTVLTATSISATTATVKEKKGSAKKRKWERVPCFFFSDSFLR